MPIKPTAPYNFVPIADWVHEPKWASCVSHDRPFADGMSGALQIEIRPHTPFLVGAPPVQVAGAVKAIHPCRAKFGGVERYYIPGNSIRGAIAKSLDRQLQSF